LSPIRIGVPSSICVRPLIYGLIRTPQPGVEVLYDEPGILADRLEQHELDAALVPAIEYLRGVGSARIDGPALVARPAGHGVVLIARRPLGEIERVAVHEFCRTPIAALRITLDRLHGARPDLLVEKNFGGDWRERYDAILLTGDAALDIVSHGHAAELEVHNVVEMWTRVAGHPLPLDVWAYNSSELQATFAKWLVTSRNLGLQNLSRLADGIAATSQYDGETLYEYFTHSWSYDLGGGELAALESLEELSVEYDLVRAGRLARVSV
jgi:predicted solute-binding protein